MKEGGGGVRSSCSVIFYTSGAAAQKTGKDRQNEGRVEKNKDQRVEEGGPRVTD